jgi:hypothetical protein
MVRDLEWKLQGCSAIVMSELRPSRVKNDTLQCDRKADALLNCANHRSWV